MLIIAIPKSAGTSLTETLCRNHNKKHKGGLTHYKEKEEGNIVELRHGSMKDVEKEDVEKFKDNDIIYHEHIFPTKNNIKNLENQKKVILLREPEEILHSWWRAEQSGTHQKHPMLKDCKTKEDYIRKAEKLGALKILQDFKNGWEKAKNKKDLIIYYEDIKNSPKEVINKIEKHFGLHESKNPELLKMRYNKGSKLRKIAKKIYNQLHKIGFLVKIKRKLFPNFTFG